MAVEFFILESGAECISARVAHCLTELRSQLLDLTLRPVELGSYATEFRQLTYRWIDCSIDIGELPGVADLASAIGHDGSIAGPQKTRHWPCEVQPTSSIAVPFSVLLFSHHRPMTRFQS